MSDPDEFRQAIKARDIERVNACADRMNRELGHRRPLPRLTFADVEELFWQEFGGEPPPHVKKAGLA